MQVIAAYRNTERSARYTAQPTEEQRIASQVAFLERRKRELGAELTTMIKAREKAQRRLAYERKMAEAEMQRDRERFAEEIAEHERRLSIVLSAIDRRERNRPRDKEDFVPTFNRIAGRICKALRVPVVDLLSAKQDRDTALARQAFCYWAHRRTGAGPVLIGKYLARDHSTVMHGRRTYAAKRFKMGRNLRVLQ